MKRDKIHILIVDDDSTQGKALQEVFQRAGYQAQWCNTSTQALTWAERQEFHCMIVDCVLPKINGVDLVVEILAANPNHKPKIFMYSGIFKDRSFIKDTIARTKCEAFLQKPLDLQELIGQVDHVFRDQLGKEDEPALMSLYQQVPPTDEMLVDIITRESTIQALHVPQLLRCMQKTRLSGELTLITGVGDVNSISFFDGNVFSVRTPDKESFFGGLAVAFGFVSPEDVVGALKAPEKKMLGQKLIESTLLSPHAINIIMEEQLALRLSQCIQNNVVSLQWTARKFGKPDYALNPLRFDGLMEDWLQSKFDPEWIRSVLSFWGEFRIEGAIHPNLSGPMTLDELMAHSEFEDGRDLPFLFRQLYFREAYFGSATENLQDFGFLESRLDKIAAEQKDQNFYQILGVGEKAHSKEINKAFNDLKQHFDPAKLPSNCPPPVRVKCTQVFSLIENAFKTLSDDTARGKYLMVLQNKRSQRILEKEPQFRAAIAELQGGHPYEAGMKFQQLLNQKIEFRDLRAYRIWAGLKHDRNFKAITLDQVPPEERHSPAYMMAKGVNYRNKGQIQKALECFRTAHMLDPKLNIAKNELKDMISDMEKTRGTNKAMLREVTSVVENLFGRKRGA